MTANRSRAGFVYFVRSPFGLTKIGCTRDLARRMERYTHCDILHTIPASDPRGLEARFHAHFDPKRRRGEWFCLTPEDIVFVQRLPLEYDALLALEPVPLVRKLELYVSLEWHRRLLVAAKRVKLSATDYVRRAVERVADFEDELIDF